MAGEISYRSAFIALLGRPNTGKSTLVNTVLGEHISIVSSLPQTTRKNFRGIYTEDGMQLVFVDTPGVHRGRHRFNKAMYRQSLRAVTEEEVDLVCWMIDTYREYGAEEDAVAEIVRSAESPVLLIFNKADLCTNINKARNDFFAKYPDFESCPTVTISARNPSSKDEFLSFIRPFVPEGPQFFPEDDYTDADMRFFAAEFIRAELIALTKHEVPHSCFVEIFRYRESMGRHEVDANIHVETQGQKGIVVGKSGSGIRRIRIGASARLSQLAQAPVTLRCHVKVTPRWRDNARFLDEMGYSGKSN